MFGNYFKPVNLLDLKDPHVLPNDLDNAVNGGGVTLWHKATARDISSRPRRRPASAKHTGWTLDIGHGDFNNDGLQDIYLACDYGTDRIFFNNGDGTFRDVTEKAIGFDTKKGMNVDVADYDNDGWLDIYVTNITDEYMKECNMLWHNNDDGTFTDRLQGDRHLRNAVGLGRQVRRFRQRRLAGPVRGQRAALGEQGKLHSGAGEHDHQAGRGLHRRQQLAGHRRHDLERLSEEEDVPQPGGRRRSRKSRPKPAWTTTRTAAASAWRISTTTAGSISIRPTPTRPALLYHNVTRGRAGTGWS